jgi:NAD(P)H-nitrite reductase large subunit
LLRSIGEYETRHIDLFLNETVTAMDTEKRLLNTDAGRTIAFEKLLIASGGRVRAWEYEHVLPERILRFQTLDDAERIRAAIAAQQHGSAVVIGGGFIAMELVGIFMHAELQTTLLSRSAYFWERFLEEAGGELVEALFRIKGVALAAVAEVVGVQRVADKALLSTADGKQFSADLVGVGIGLERNMEFLDPRITHERGVRVDAYLQTNIEHVWAAGDVAEYQDPFSGRWRTVGNWTQAFMQGRIAGVNMTGGHEQFRTVAVYSTKLFDTVFTTIGDPERGAAREVYWRAAPESRRYEQFTLQEHKLIGAVLINAFDQASAASALIEQGTDISGAKTVLTTPGKDLRILVRGR